MGRSGCIVACLCVVAGLADRLPFRRLHSSLLSDFRSPCSSIHSPPVNYLQQGKRRFCTGAFLVSYLVEDRDGAFFLFGVKVGVGFECDFHVGVAEAAGDLFYVDPGVTEKGSVGVPELVDCDVFDACPLSVPRVSVLNGGVRDRGGAAADKEALVPSSRLFLSFSVL